MQKAAVCGKDLSAVIIEAENHPGPHLHPGVLEARRLKPKLKVLLTSGYTAAVLTDEHRLPKEFPVLGKPYRREQLASNLREIIKSPAPRVNAD